MDLSYLFLTAPQWLIFVSLVAIIYGWIEQKRIFWQIGCVSLFLLGLFALYAILNGLVAPDLYVAEDELQIENIDLTELPRELHLIPIYWSLVLNGLLSFITLVLMKSKTTWYKWMTVGTMLVSLGIFFMLFDALKA